MSPPGIFEGWIYWPNWGLALAIDFNYKRIWGQFGPLQGAINWSNF